MPSKNYSTRDFSKMQGLLKLLLANGVSAEDVEAALEDRGRTSYLLQATLLATGRGETTRTLSQRRMIMHFCTRYQDQIFGGQYKGTACFEAYDYFTTGAGPFKLELLIDALSATDISMLEEIAFERSTFNEYADKHKLRVEKVARDAQNLAAKLTYLMVRYVHSFTEWDTIADMLDERLSRLAGLDAYLASLLEAGGIKTLGQLVSATDDELQAIERIGAKRLGAVKELFKTRISM